MSLAMWRYGIAVVLLEVCSFLVPRVPAVDSHLEIDEPILLPTMDIDPTESSSFEPTVMIGNLPSVLPTVFGDNLQHLSDLISEVTLKDDNNLHSLQDAINEKDKVIKSASSLSGEGYRALGQARSLEVLKPEQSTITKDAAEINTLNQMNNSAGRTSNPDIQDIISGFVKLLNTNVQATQAARPLRTRINNRGPPRITDLVLPPNTRPPYLFQRPPPPPPVPMKPPTADLPIRPFLSGVPLPEQIIPRPSPPLATVFSPPTVITPITRPTFTTVPEPEDKFVDLTSVLSIDASSVLTNFTTESPHLNVMGLQNTSHTEVYNKTEIKGNNSNTEPVKETFEDHTKVVNIEPSLSSTMSVSDISLKNQTSSSSSVPSIVPSMTVNNTLYKTETTFSVQKIDTAPPLNLTNAITTTVIESSMQEITTEIHQKPTRWQSSTIQTEQTYYPRPGIVLDDPEYKPGSGVGKPHKTVIHHHHRTPSLGDIFDVTVSAVQVDGRPQAAQTGQPFIYPVEVDSVSVITTAEAGQHFVSIDGKRTYINLQGSPTNIPNGDNNNNNEKTGVGYVSASTERHPLHQHHKPLGGRPHFHRPTHPPVRIDTCIVGDDSTCDAVQHEHCRTEFGVSSCQCRPGYSRRRHREQCHRVASLVLSLRVDRLYEHRLVWSAKLLDRDSYDFLQIEYEASRAIDSALSMTPYSDELVGSHVNNVYKGTGASGGVYINMTVQLEDNPLSLTVKRSEESLMQDMHRQLVAAIHRRGNNIGNSGLWVDNPPDSVSPVYDLDECSSSELHDCHVHAVCHNVFGSFRCVCREGLRDPMAADELRSGRQCEACPPDLCGHRGHCYYEANTGQPVCKCLGNFYGAQCQIDGEVLGVAIGASLLAVLIIAGTLACLCVWSRKWSREDDGMTQYPPYTLQGMKVPRYGICLDERLRWAQMADTTNHYAPEPVCRGPPICTPSQLYGRVPPPPGPLSSSEEDDLHLLGGGAFHVPRPKSTSNESAIYWTAEYSHHTGPRMVTAQF